MNEHISKQFFIKVAAVLVFLVIEAVFVFVFVTGAASLFGFELRVGALVHTLLGLALVMAPVIAYVDVTRGKG